MKLRNVGGEWWSRYSDSELTMISRLYSDEKNGRFLDWPDNSGVWLPTETRHSETGSLFRTVRNALTVDEQLLGEAWDSSTLSL
jgi:hypothetical protein